ncbi:MAG: nucleoid-associated protein [Balneola sp.]
MAFITEEQNREMQIERFIFHVVHHGEEEPILLDETPIGIFHNFFIGRVREVLKGNRFLFVPESSTERKIRSVDDNLGNFVEASKNLARDFHRFGDSRVKPGVLIFMVINAADEKLYSLIKYDHEEVLTYRVEDDRRAILESVTNSLTKSTKSLHKSGLIRLDDETGGNLIVVDRKVTKDISDFFKGFLNVRRKYDSSDMTKRIQDLTIKTAQDHKVDLPNEITRRIRQRAYDTICQLDAFNSEQFFDMVFGAHGSEEIRSTFNSYLEKNDLDGEMFEFDNDAVEKPKNRKFKTSEGVKIEYSETADETVVIEPDEVQNKTRITITTNKLLEL